MAGQLQPVFHPFYQVSGGSKQHLLTGVRPLPVQDGQVLTVYPLSGRQVSSSVGLVLNLPGLRGIHFLWCIHFIGNNPGQSIYLFQFQCNQPDNKGLKILPLSKKTPADLAGIVGLVSQPRYITKYSGGRMCEKSLKTSCYCQMSQPRFPSDLRVVPDFLIYKNS